MIVGTMINVNYKTASVHEYMKWWVDVMTDVIGNVYERIVFSWLSDRQTACNRKFLSSACSYISLTLVLALFLP